MATLRNRPHVSVSSLSRMVAEEISQTTYLVLVRGAGAEQRVASEEAWPEAISGNMLIQSMLPEHRVLQ